MKAYFLQSKDVGKYYQYRYPTMSNKDHESFLLERTRSKTFFQICFQVSTIRELKLSSNVSLEESSLSSSITSSSFTTVPRLSTGAQCSLKILHPER